MKSHKTKIHLVFPLAAVVAFSAHSQEATHALLPEAQKSFDKGTAAIDQQEWSLAARYFSDAAKLDPYDPRVLLNLGLAYDKSDNDIPAIAWLHAYLAAMPDAKNAHAVQSEITNLEKRAHDKIITIWKAADEARSHLRGDDKYSFYFGGGSQQRTMLGDFTATNESQMDDQLAEYIGVRLGSDAPDIIAAKDALAKIKSPVKQDEVISNYFVGWFLGKGDIDSAREIVGQIHDSAIKAGATHNVMMASLRQTIIKNEENKEYDPAPIEEFLNAGGDDWSLIFNARCSGKDFAAAHKMIERQSPSGPDLSSLSSLALVELEAGDRSAATATANEVLTIAARHNPTSDYNKYFSFGCDVAQAEAILGNYKYARNSAKTVFEYDRKNEYGQDWIISDRTLPSLAEIAILNGKASEAKEIEGLARTLFSDQWPYTTASIAYTYLNHEKVKQAIDTITKVETKGNCVAVSVKIGMLGTIISAQIEKRNARDAEKDCGLLPDVQGFNQEGYFSFAPFIYEYGGSDWVEGEQFEVQDFLSVAKAYHRENKDADSRRMITMALKSVEAAQSNAELQKLKPDSLYSVLEQIAETQKAIGDETDARITFAKIPPLSKELNARIALARELSTADSDAQRFVVDTAAEVAKAQQLKATEIPNQLSQIGYWLGIYMLKISALDDEYDVHKSGDTPHIPPQQPPPQH